MEETSLTTVYEAYEALINKREELRKFEQDKNEKDKITAKIYAWIADNFCKLLNINALIFMS